MSTIARIRVLATPLRRRRHAAWLAPALPAAAATVYLAWGAWTSATDRAWLYRGHVWWHLWLRPGDDVLALAFIGLWLAAALAYWWPRRGHLPDVGLVVVAAMVVVGAVLGTASLAPCRGGQSRTAVAAWVLSLYVGSLEPRYGHTMACHLPYPLGLQLGRLVCLGATFTSAVAAAAVLWQQPLGRLRARLVKDATIVTGLDAMTIPLLRRLTDTGRPSSVVVIEPDRNHPLLEQARSTGAQIAVADPRSRHVLLPLLRGLRGPQLRRLFALRPEAADNEAILVAAQRVLSRERADPDRPPHLVARIDDPRHAEVWRGARVGASPLWFSDALSPQESTARTLAGQVARAGARQVLLCGDSALALAILLELARSAWERESLADAAGQGRAAGGGFPDSGDGQAHRAVHHRVERVLLLDQRAADLRREYLATSPPAVVGALPAVEARAEPWQSALLPVLDAASPEQVAAAAVVIAEEPSEASLHEAGRVARLHPDASVFVLVSDGAGVADAVFDRLRPFQRTLLVDGDVPEDSWTRIARLWHESYRLAHPAGAAGNKELTRRPWQDLDEFVLQDNILQLRSVMAAVVVRLGRRWVPGRAVRPGSFVELSDDEVRQVACAEHTRWYERRWRAGWRAAADGRPDDDSARVNDSVRPWAELPAGKRDQACRQIRQQLAQLEAIGFLPELRDEGPDGAACFRRVGEVRARRLADRRRWRSAAGDEFSAVAGDWLVVDELGHERTVRDEQFRASHSPLGADRWRREGLVRAWRVGEAVAVRTIEGAAVAQPGDWIVQGPGGERWPVRDEQFRRGYLPADRLAGPPD